LPAPPASQPVILAVMLVQEDEVRVYQERGTDFIVAAVEDIVGCLPEGLGG